MRLLLVAFNIYELRWHDRKKKIIIILLRTHIIMYAIIASVRNRTLNGTNYYIRTQSQR